MCTSVSATQPLTVLWLTLCCLGMAIVTDDLLKFNRSLTSLTLSSNKITMEGAKAIGKLLSQGSTLAHLNISSNTLGDEGGMVIAEVHPSSASCRAACALTGAPLGAAI